jgi:hypothetical protein
VECKNKSYTSIIKGNWKHLKAVQKISEQFTVKNDSKELQKATILGTAHVQRKVLLQKYKTFITRNIVTCTKNFKPGRDATIYTLETSFVSGA